MAYNEELANRVREALAGQPFCSIISRKSVLAKIP